MLLISDKGAKKLSGVNIASPTNNARTTECPQAKRRGEERGREGTRGEERGGKGEEDRQKQQTDSKNLNLTLHLIQKLTQKESWTQKYNVKLQHFQTKQRRKSLRPKSRQRVLKFDTKRIIHKRRHF